MPYVLDFNSSAVAQKMELLARFLGLEHPSHHAVLDWILKLREELEIPHRLADLGVNARHVTEFARMALVDPPSATNPVPLNLGNLSELYHRAIEGDLAGAAGV